MSLYWPGTKIIKSRGNAFDWRKDHSEILNDKDFLFSARSKQNAAGSGSDKRKQFTIYSRARPSARRGVDSTST